MPWPLASVLSSLASRAGGGVSENAFQQRVSQYAGTSHALTARSARGQQEVTRCLPVPVFFRTGVAACLDALALTAARYVSCHQQNVHAHSTSVKWRRIARSLRTMKSAQPSSFFICL